MIVLIVVVKEYDVITFVQWGEKEYSVIVLLIVVKNYDVVTFVQ